MTDDAPLEERLRATLRTWADEAPIAAPATPSLPDARAGRASGAGRRRPRLPLLVGAGAGAVALVAAVLVLDEPSPQDLEVVGQDDVVTSEIPVGDALGVRVLALGEDGLYVASENDRRVFRVDLDSGEVTDGPALGVPDGVAVADDSVFVVLDDPLRLARLDPVTLEPSATVDLPGEPTGVAVVDDLVWVRDESGVTSRFDGDLDDAGQLPVALTDGFQAVGGAGLWRTDPDGGAVQQLDPATGEVLQRVVVGGEPWSVVVDDRGAWVGDRAGERVLHVDAETGEVDRTVAVGRFPHGMALGDGRLWVTNFEDGTLTTIGTDRGVVLSTVPIGVRPGGLRLDDGTLWVAVHQEGLVRAVDTDVLEQESILPVAESQLDVDLGGRSLFIRCMGTGGPDTPTVLLEAATTQWSEHQLYVQYGLQPTHRVCAYDRAGLGRSDPGAEPRTAQGAVDDLDEALRVAGIEGPYVLVGNLQGGLYARLFAAQHPDDVRALVLVDSLWPTFFDDVRPLLDPDELAEFDAGLADPEFSGVDETAAQIAAAGSLGDLPVVVLTGDDVLGHLGADGVELWQRQQRAMLDLSTDSRLVVVPDGTGAMPLEAPTAVVQAVLDVSG